jgi:alpha-amylase
VKWLTRWVQDYGVDGFRADTVKHVEYESWTLLKEAGVKALADWKAAHPRDKVDDAPFWMTGEYWGQGIERTRHFDIGFDNMINFDFQSRADAGGAALDRVFSDYAKVLAAPATHNVLSYLSSHDTKLFDRKKLFDGALALMLAPGGVQIYYGDETARPDGLSAPGDRQQSTRSDMNWDSVDMALLAHWRKLGSFRARHVALARGQHAKLADAPYVFSRSTAADRVVVALGAKGAVKLPVAGMFADGSTVRDAYGGATATVAGGSVEIVADPAGVILLEPSK